MNLRRLKHTLLRMNLQEKIIGLGSILIMIGSFFPWFSHSNAANNSDITEYGFSGDLGVMGFVIFIMSLLSLLALVSENLRIPFPKLGFQREKILFFFLGQSAFLCLLTMAIYTKQSLDFLEGGLRFGIFIVLAASLFSALAAFNLIKKVKRSGINNPLDFESDEASEAPLSSESHHDMVKEAENALKKNPEAELNFQEDVAILDETEASFENRGQNSNDHPITKPGTEDHQIIQK